MRPARAPLAHHWLLDEQVVFLNHGSFGACPLPVLQRQDDYRRAMERQPVRYLLRELEESLWQSKEALAGFVGAPATDIVWVPNATYALNTVLNSLKLEPGDELLTTNHVYGACFNALQQKARLTGACVVVADVPFPLTSEQQIVDAVRAAITPRTRFALIDHITSPTALIFPVRELVQLLQAAGVDCFVDGAHVPGQIELNLKDIGAAYYAGNAHKWLCTPKGSAFLYVRRDRQEPIRPLVTSHVYDVPGQERRSWSNRFFWPGTCDFSPWLCIADALKWLTSLSGSLPDLMQQNHQRCIQATRILCQQHNLPAPAPDDMLPCMAAFSLGPAEKPPYNFGYIHPLQQALWERYAIEVPVFVWGHPPQLILRISSYCYNILEQYEYLSEALNDLLRHQELRRST